MKRINVVLTILLIAVFFVFAMGSSESETVDQGSGSANVAQKDDNQIGKYKVVIDSCRLGRYR